MVLGLLCWQMTDLAVLAANRKEPPAKSPPQIVRYEDFGARGDGVTDDIEAICKAHEFANQRGWPVRANDDAVYFIGRQKKTAVIETDTDFGSARFVIDDTDVEDRTAQVFEVRSTLPPSAMENIPSLRRNQPRLDTTLPHRSLVVAQNSSVRHFIRRGLNQDSGFPQTDIFIVEKDGTIDPDTPIVWDFEQVTVMTAHPINPVPLTVRGGRFTTLANRAEPKHTYYARGIVIKRSNVTIQDLQHRITGEGEQGAPYAAFLRISDCADVTVRDSIFSGHKIYQTIGSAGLPVSMGSYDLSVWRSARISFINCCQFNDIHDRTRWGIMTSNYAKQLLYDRCTLSRFDAHKGVFGATIQDSSLGHGGIQIIGGGTFTVKNTTVRSANFINLRNDYGSTWNGDLSIQNCTFVPTSPGPGGANIFSGENDGTHDFG